MFHTLYRELWHLQAAGELGVKDKEQLRPWQAATAMLH